jgi:hypothetical protein
MLKKANSRRLAREVERSMSGQVGGESCFGITYLRSIT